MKRASLLVVVLVAAALVAVERIVTACGVQYYLTQLIMSAYYAVVVMGLCLVMGYTGQISLGHAAFFATGGYTSAILTTAPIRFAAGSGWGSWLERLRLIAARQDLYGEAIVTVTPWAAFVAAMAITFFVACLIGYPALRLKGHYLAMATLGFGLIVYRIVLGTSFMGAADGIHGVPPWNLGPGITICGDKAERIGNFYAAWAVTLTILVLLQNLVRSRIGRALRAIHDGELAANAMGIDTAAYKFRVFILSALLAAAAGCLLTHYNGGIGPSEAGALKSVRYVVLVAAGGMANLWGVLVVSTTLNFLSLRGCFGTYDHAVFGIILVAIISLAPEGPLKPIGAWIGGFSAGRAPRS
jgi:branched-chain amino acid transport system permease protein